VTVRVTTLKHATAGCYYTDHLPSYYLDGDEPPGLWWGRGADLLGLDGEVDAEVFLNVMAGLDPSTGSRLGRRYGEESVRGFDATFSAPKSVSVLFAVADPEIRGEVTDAHDRAVAAVLGWVEDHAHTRMRRRGHIVCVDTEGIAAAVFRQHTSRRLDPQLHSHTVIVNRVKAPDGRWLALDARTIKLDQRTLSALYHATLRTELTRRLGVQWHPPEHGIAEIAGIDQTVLRHFSTRTREMDDRLAVKLARFRTEFQREPTRRERWQLEREAAVDSRPHKPDERIAGRLHHYWRLRLELLGHEPAHLIDTVTDRHPRPLGITPEMTAGMVDRSLEALAERQSTWRPAELVRELAATVPTDVTVDSEELTGFLQRVADHVAATRCVDISPPVPNGVPLRRDGRPVTEAVIHRTLTTQAVIDEEERIAEWAQRRLSVQDQDPAHRWGTHDPAGLSPGQTAVGAAVAGSTPLELIIGPAGAGKTTALAPAVKDLQARGRPVFGVAATAAAAEVLATETAMAADTLDKLLHEHHHPDRSPAPGYDLPAGATVIVDEAGTVSTPKLAALAALADQHHWRVVLVGDPRQFSAVGRGGMFTHLIDTHGAIELDQIHRFTHPWERTASLKLRNGDPGVLAEYDRRGRLHGGTPEQLQTEILQAWTHARQRGETVALMANSTATVDRLNHLAQQTRIDTGELDPTGSRLRVGDQRLLVGDVVVTRRNNRTLRTDRNLMVKNRDHWTVQAIHPDRSVTLTGRTGTIRLPADYVTDHVELGYAQTSHATQGRTVDTALLLIDTPTDNRGVYTPMTRGRHTNHAYVTVDDNQTATDVLGQAMTRDWIDQPAIARRNQLDEQRARLSSSMAADDRAPTHAGPDGRHEPESASASVAAEDTRVREIDESIQRQRRTIARDRGDHGIGR